MQALRIAIIGAGMRATSLLEQLQDGAADGERSAVCDIDRDRLDRFVKVVRGDAPKTAESQAGYLATLLAERADQSMREGRTIAFSPRDFEGITAAG